MVWDFSKESYNERDKAYCANRLALIRALDGYQRLVTAHDDWALHFDQRAGLLDFVTDQKHDNFAERTIHLRRLLRPCPVINEEFAYECGPGGVEDLSYHPRVRHTAEEHVLRSWEVVFGGAYPGYYYLYTAWDVVRPEDLPRATPCTGAWWTSCARAPGGSWSPTRRWWSARWPAAWPARGRSTSSSTAPASAPSATSTRPRGPR